MAAQYRSSYQIVTDRHNGCEFRDAVSLRDGIKTHLGNGMKSDVKSITTPISVVGSTSNGRKYANSCLRSLFCLFLEHCWISQYNTNLSSLRGIGHDAMHMFAIVRQNLPRSVPNG